LVLEQNDHYFTAVKKTSGHPRVSSKHQDRHLWNRVTSGAELLNIGSEFICTHSGAKTLGQRPGVKEGGKQATFLQEET